MKIVFIDIDVVLNNEKSLQLDYNSFCPENVRLLNEIIEKTGAKLVISSTWRLMHPDIIDIFKSEGVTGEIVGMTPDLSIQQNGLFRSVIRGEEIQFFLDNWKGETIDNFVILDDENDMGNLLPKLVQTDFCRGLSIFEAEKTIEILGEA